MAHHKLLKDIYLFQDFNEHEMKNMLEAVEVRTFPADADVFRQGEVAQAFFIINTGSVRIHQKSSDNDNLEVAVLGSGSHFGEMPFVDGEKRSATATAIEDTELLILDYGVVKSLIDRNGAMAVKIYKAIAQFLCGRLRVTTSDLSFAREKNLRFF